jgi:hypothetical protein
VLWVALAVVALLAVALNTLPTRVARHLLASELERLGLSLEGLETLEVEVIEGEASIGPVQVRAAGTEPAVVRLLDLDVGLRALLQDRVVIESLVVRGIELLVSRDAAGQITINGNVVAPPTRGKSTRESVRDLLGGRDLGVERLEIRDSRLLYETAAGGRLSLDVDRFTLGGLHAWQPDDAASFALEARANGISIDWSGTVSPFASEPAFAVDSAVEGIEIERVESLIGSWGVTKRAGVASFHGRHEASMPDSGVITGHTRGRFTISGLDVQREAGPSLAARRVEGEIDARHEIDHERRWRVAGRIGLDADELALGLRRQARVAFRSIALALEDLEAGTQSDGSLSLRWVSTVEAQEGRFAGRVQISAELLIEIVRLLQFLATSVGRDEGLTGLEVWADREFSTPRSEVEASRVTVRNRHFEYRGGVGTFSLALDTEAEAAEVRVVSRQQSTDIGTVNLSLADIRLQAAERSLVLEGAVSASAAEVVGVRDRGRAEMESLEARLERLDLRSENATLTGTLTGGGELSGMRGTVPERNGAPPASFSIQAARARVDTASVVASPDTGRWAVRGQAEGEGVVFDVGHGLMATAAIERAELRDVEVDERLRIKTNAAVLTGTALAATRSFLTGIASGEVAKDAGAVARPASGRAAPLSERALVEDAQWLLEELGYDPGPLDGLVGPKTVAATKAFQGASGLPVDGRVTPELLGALELAVRPRPPAAVERIGRRPTFEIAQLVAIDGARVHFSDDSVDPDVDVHMAFDELSIIGLDTGDPTRPAELRASAEINEFSQIEVEGRVTPFKRPPDVDLQIRLADLELAPYSPYVAGLAGVAIEEGVLSSQTAISINDGAIEGQVEIDLRRLEVQPMSEEDAQRVADTIGVQADTALRLLKDAEGRIELTIPVSGTVEKPDVDVSDAVNRAVVGVLAAIFPPNIIAAMFRGGGDDVEFEPLVFVPGSHELDAAAQEYLDRLAALMGEHPDVIITMCGRSVARDTDAIATMLSQKLGVTVPAREGNAGTPERRVASHAGALAVDRARSARRYLIGERGVGPASITECRSTFDAADEGPPRVEIAL